MSIFAYALSLLHFLTHNSCALPLLDQVGNNFRLRTWAKGDQGTSTQRLFEPKVLFLYACLETLKIVTQTQTIALTFGIPQSKVVKPRAASRESMREIWPTTFVFDLSYFNIASTVTAWSLARNY